MVEVIKQMDGCGVLRNLMNYVYTHVPTPTDAYRRLLCGGKCAFHVRQGGYQDVSGLELVRI